MFNVWIILLTSAVTTFALKGRHVGGTNTKGKGQRRMTSNSQKGSTTSSKSKGVKRLSLKEFKGVLKTEANEEFIIDTAVNCTVDKDEYAETMFQQIGDEEWDLSVESEESKRPFVICNSKAEASGYERSLFMSALFSSVTEFGEPLSNSADLTCWIIPTTAQETELAVESDLEGTLSGFPLTSVVKLLGSTLDAIQACTTSSLVVLLSQPTSETDMKSIWGTIMAELGSDQEEGNGGNRRLASQNFLWKKAFESPTKKMDSRNLRSTNSDSSTSVHDLHHLNARAKMWHRALQLAETDQQCSSATSRFSFSPIEGLKSFEVQFGDGCIDQHCVLALIVAIVNQPQVSFVAHVPKIKLSYSNSNLSPVQKSALGGDTMLDNGLNRWYEEGISGEGVIVGVADTGLDGNHCYISDGLPFLLDTFDDSRRKVVYYWGADTTDHKGGHGTHVSSTIVGSREDERGRFEGIAPNAKLAFFDISDDQEGGGGCCVLPKHWANFLTRAYNAGKARIENISWGIEHDQAETYSADYRIYDQWFDAFVYNNPYMLIIVAAGNEGPYSSSIASPSIGKNVLSVGMSFMPDDLQDHLVAGSARGPTTDGRIKPDIVAPGKFITSAFARPDVTEGVCDYGEDPADDSDNGDGLRSLYGTSMSAPVVSGTAALLIQYFMEGRHINGSKNDDEGFEPRAALLKATLLNAAVPILGIEGVLGGTQEYDNSQGYGRLSLGDSLPLGSNGVSALVVNNRMFERTGDYHEYWIQMNTEDVCESSVVSTTLVWVDSPSIPGCVQCTLNDLDLEITVYNEDKILYPNGMSNADPVNTVERIRASFNQGDLLNIRVKAANLLNETQDYSLIASGCFDIADEPTGYSAATYLITDITNTSVTSSTSASSVSSTPSSTPTGAPSALFVATPSSSPSVSVPPSNVPTERPVIMPSDKPSPLFESQVEILSSAPTLSLTDRPVIVPSGTQSESQVTATAHKGSLSNDTPGFSPLVNKIYVPMRLKTLHGDLKYDGIVQPPTQSPGYSTARTNSLFSCQLDGSYCTYDADCCSNSCYLYSCEQMSKSQGKKQKKDTKKKSKI